MVDEGKSSSMGGVSENRAALCMGRGRVGELSWASLIAQITNLPAMQETPVQFLGLKDPLEKG